MKITALKSLLAALVLGLCASSTALAAGDWVGDWFDQSSTTQPGSLKTQQRGYYTGGSFQARWRMSNDYPVSVSPPRFSAGCGGIDLFGGGFSFMDPEFLVQKFERAIQAAPAIAFQMAMSEYCKECSNAMTTMEQITNYLNGIQVNDCRMAKGIATVVVPKKGDTTPFRDRLEKEMQGYAVDSGLSKNGQAVDEKVKSTEGKAPVNVKDATNGCPAVFQTVFTDGSVVDNVAGLLSLSDYAPLMRGLIGDVNVKYDTLYNNYQIVSIEPCKGNDPGDSFDLITGKVEKKAAGLNGACSVGTAKSVQDQVADRMNAVATKLAAKGSGGAALDTTQRAFVSAAPFPLLNLLRDATKNNYLDEAITSARDVLAPAYAAHMLNDIHQMSQLVLRTADEVQTKANTATNNGQKCNVKFLEPAFETIRQMDERSMVYKRLAIENYTKSLTELNANLDYANYLRQRREQSVVNDTTNAR